MTAIKECSWKILALGRGKETVDRANQHFQVIGYKNVRALAVDNDRISDEKLIEALKQQEWDGVSIGGGINGWDENFDKQAETLFWFNRLVNIIHEHAPKAKLIFVQNVSDLFNAFERVLGGQS